MDRRLDSQSKPRTDEAQGDELRGEELNTEAAEAEDVETEDEDFDDDEIAAESPPRPHLISVDMLRAAGALDVPPSWRKSLGPAKIEQRDLLSDLVDD